MAGCAGPLALSRSASPMTARLEPDVTEAAIGEPFDLRLVFENHASAPARLWIAKPGYADGWHLVLRVRRPGGDTLLLQPAVTSTTPYPDPWRDVVTLAPGEERQVRLAFASGRGSDLLDYVAWNVFTPAGLAQARRTGTFAPLTDLAAVCFNQKGRYLLDAQVDVAVRAPAAADPAPRGGAPLIQDRLDSHPVALVLH